MFEELFEHIIKEDVSTISDPKLKKMFTMDKIEDLQKRIKDLENLAKTMPKGQSKSNIYAKIDAYESEINQLKT